jgi:hypothetical protein
VREDCTVRAEATPLAYEYCRPPGDEQPPEEARLRDETHAKVRMPEPV